MYTSFFGLKVNPFQITPDPEFVLLSRTHKKALTYLKYGIAETSGFVLVTGEVGTGKTTLIRTLMRDLPQNITLAQISNTKIGPEEMLPAIADDFGIDRGGKDRARLLASLTSFLIEQHSLGRKCLLIIDEAQNLTPDVLEEIRLLSNIETDKNKLMQIMLAGQPEFSNTLARPELRQLRQRISVTCNLQPLSEAETADYVLHRLEVAGNRSAVEFGGESLKAIYSFSKGIPRLINISCDFILLTAFTEKTKRITPSLVREVTGELERTNNYWKSRPQLKQEPFRPHAGLQEIISGLTRVERLMGKMLENLENANKGISLMLESPGITSQKMAEERASAANRHTSPVVDINQRSAPGIDEKQTIWKRFFDSHVKKSRL